MAVNAQDMQNMPGMSMNHATKKKTTSGKKIKNAQHNPSMQNHQENMMQDSASMQQSGRVQEKDNMMNMNRSSDTTKQPDDMNMDHSMMHDHSTSDSTKPDSTMQMSDSMMHRKNDHPMDMDISNQNHSGMNMDMMNMDHAYSLNLPMNRDGSGTSWLPDASPMNGYMFHTRKWSYMLHGNIFLRYTNQDFTHKGSRGDDKIDAPNWLMLMGQRQVAKNGLFHFNVMMSFDPLTESGYGYPLLFQSGESWNGKSLVDRQHPHDLFSELSVSYSQALSKKSDIYFYLGYPGEPALGPVAFMHRPSAMYNPDAPISHHWIDATHITFGVATLGIRLGDFKFEGSSFTGREPNENRYNFDKPRFDSWSGRLSYNPSENWALQVSHGFIKSPEELNPGENVYRTTASAIYSLPLANDGWLNATAVWGLNKSKRYEGQKDTEGENAFLLEGSWRKDKLAVYSRYEFTQKSAEELVLSEVTYGQGALFPVHAFTLGLNYDLLHIGQTRLAGGGQYTIYHADNRLNNLYGKNPMGFEVYLRLYPGLMKM